MTPSEWAERITRGMPDAEALRRAIVQAIEESVAASEERWQRAVGMPLEQAEENARTEAEAFAKLTGRSGAADRPAPG